MLVVKVSIKTRLPCDKLLVLINIESPSTDQNIFMVEIGTALTGLGVITIIIG